jgi:hypothetical protein
MFMPGKDCNPGSNEKTRASRSRSCLGTTEGLWL